jgi:inorganic pyrophosphatase
MDFWSRLDSVFESSEMVIDRPGGTSHPRYPEMVYPLDYGYLKGTSGGDGHEVDVWRGSGESQAINAVVCTVDSLKKDVEVKLLVGCTDDEVSTIEAFHNGHYMSAVTIIRPRD